MMGSKKKSSPRLVRLLLVLWVAIPALISSAVPSGNSRGNGYRATHTNDNSNSADLQKVSHRSGGVTWHPSDFADDEGESRFILPLLSFLVPTIVGALSRSDLSNADPKGGASRRASGGWTDDEKYDEDEENKAKVEQLEKEGYKSGGVTWRPSDFSDSEGDSRFWGAILSVAAKVGTIIGTQVLPSVAGSVASTAINNAIHSPKQSEPVVYSSTTSSTTSLPRLDQPPPANSTSGPAREKIRRPKPVFKARAMMRTLNEEEDDYDVDGEDKTTFWKKKKKKTTTTTTTTTKRPSDDDDDDDDDDYDYDYDYDYGDDYDDDEDDDKTTKKPEMRRKSRRRPAAGQRPRSGRQRMKPNQGDSKEEAAATPPAGSDNAGEWKRPKKLKDFGGSMKKHKKTKHHGAKESSFDEEDSGEEVNFGESYDDGNNKRRARRRGRRSVPGPHVSSKLLVGSLYETKDQANFVTSTGVKQNARLFVNDHDG